MGFWTLDDIAWDRIDRSKVEPEILAIVKAASLVEQNGADYARYLCNVFHDDPAFRSAAMEWGAEEIQHGQALGRWAELADPAFDHAAASARFSAGFRVNLRAQDSVRGTRSGELIARCVVESGTSSYYSALADATAEPVLKEICRRIAADEFRHYRLFYRHLKRYLEHEELGVWDRLRVAAGRVIETEDDELAYAFYAANENERPYDREKHSAAYLRRTYGVYRAHHIAHGIGMIFRAVGLNAHGTLQRLTSRLAWGIMCYRKERMRRIAA